MEKGMIITDEMYKKAKECKSVEEIMALARENGVELSEEQAKGFWEKLNPANGEISDDELDNISGGGCGGGEEVKYCPRCGSQMVGYVYMVSKTQAKRGWACRNCEPNNPYIQPY